MTPYLWISLVLVSLQPRMQCEIYNRIGGMPIAGYEEGPLECIIVNLLIVLCPALFLHGFSLINQDD